MFSFTLSAFIAGYFYNENKIEFNTASFFFLIIVSICGSINAFIYAVISNSNSDVNLFFSCLKKVSSRIILCFFWITDNYFHSQKGDDMNDNFGSLFRRRIAFCCYHRIFCYLRCTAIQYANSSAADLFSKNQMKTVLNQSTNLLHVEFSSIVIIKFL